MTEFERRYGRAVGPLHEIAYHHIRFHIQAAVPPQIINHSGVRSGVRMYDIPVLKFPTVTSCLGRGGGRIPSGKSHRVSPVQIELSFIKRNLPCPVRSRPAHSSCKSGPADYRLSARIFVPSYEVYRHISHLVIIVYRRLDRDLHCIHSGPDTDSHVSVPGFRQFFPHASVQGQCGSKQQHRIFYKTHIHLTHNNFIIYHKYRASLSQAAECLL